MKNILTAIALLISLNGFGQAITDVTFEYDGAISIAIPPQQKQDDGDVWDEAIDKASEYADDMREEKGFVLPTNALEQHQYYSEWYKWQQDYLKQHYNLTRK